MEQTKSGTLKPEAWASQALGLLNEEIVLTGLVTRDGGANFTGAEGDRVNFKRPSKLKARELSLKAHRADASITLDKLNEYSIDVTLDREVYHAVGLTPAELDLDVASYGAQVIDPQTVAVADHIELALAKYVSNQSPAVKTAKLTTDAEGAVTSDGTAIRAAIVQLRKALNSEGVPAAGRILAIGTAVEAALLGDDHLTKLDESGTGEALRSAILGALYGFRIVTVQHLPESEMIAFHPSAFILISRAPAIPSGGPVGSSKSYGGVALTVQKDYDANARRERSIVNTYAGLGMVTDIPAAEYAKLTGAETLDALKAKAVMCRSVKATVTKETTKAGG
ncbi:P22 phage major capsid protein family protein [Kitasatospora sp. NPDC003701]